MATRKKKPAAKPGKKRKPKPNPIDTCMQRAAEAVTREILSGRPTKYRPEYAEIAHELCLRGAGDCELAKEFQVSTSTIWQWTVRHKEFSSAVHSGKDAYDDRIERALAQRAMGYSFHTEKLFHYQGQIVKEETIEHLPPDVGAAKMWLCNRRPDKWRDSKQHEHSGPQGGPIQVEHDMSDIDLARRIAFIFGEAMSARQVLELTADDAPESNT